MDEADLPKEKLSKGQLKKLKEKQKKEAAEAAAKKAAEEGGSKPEAKAETPAAGGGGKKGKGGKKINAAAAAALEKKKLLDELKAKEEEEERIRLEKEQEEERLRQAELEKERLAKEAKSKEKADKIQELKDKGEYLTKAQLKKKKEMEAKRARLIANGTIKPEDVDDDDGDQPKKSHVVKNRKQKNKNPNQEDEGEKTKQDDNVESATQNKSDVAESKTQIQEKKVDQKKAEVKDEDSDVLDNWEDGDLDEMANQAKVVEDIGQFADQNADEDKVTEQSLQQEETQKTKQPGKQKGGKGKKNQEEQKVSDTLFDMQNDTVDAKKQRELARQERFKKQQEDRKNVKEKGDRKLRCPIICILGHVDTGKTLILDKLRKTNVQAGEAGGITQQIGATYFPKDYIQDMVDKTNGRIEIDLKLPGFLVIDTPGHESFTNLRSRGSSLCDFAILVVDLMHGLEQQTLESMELLRQKKTPFIVALNKCDRIFKWKSTPYNNFRDSLDQQQSSSKTEFQNRCQSTILAFAEQGLNTILYWENNEVEEFISLCPTSAITGEGLPDLLTYLSLMCQVRISRQLYEKQEFECSVLEVKVIEGLGTTIDVVLLNGVLKIQDTVVLQGFTGPIVTQIRALLTPAPMKEMRVKNEYIHNQQIKGAMGIKISAPGLEQAIAGTELLKSTGPKDIDKCIKQIEDNMYDILDKYVDKNQDGVCVQASTLGSLEALLEFLRTSKIPVVSVAIGPVHKNNVLKAQKALINEDASKIKKEFGCILAFDVRITPEAQTYAEKEGIKIFEAKIIYHLFDSFTEYVKICQEERVNAGSKDAVFPCALEIVPEAVFNRSDPIIIGVNVKGGILKVGTPLCVPDKDNLKIGVVESLELNKKSVQQATPKDGSVAVRISGASNVTFGRHFEGNNQICSRLTRKSIDSLKNHFRDQMTMDDWRLVKNLKAMYKIE